MGELSVMSGISVRDVGDVAKAAKDLWSAGLSPESHFEMFIMTEREAWHASWPLLEIEYPDVGISDGDLTSVLLVLELLESSDLKKTLENTAIARYEVLQAAS